jgi:hypothetical protein
MRPSWRARPTPSSSDEFLNGTGFLHYARTKLGLADALGALIAGGANPYEHSRPRILAALTELLEAGVPRT